MGDYFTVDEASMFKFYTIPQVLFADGTYKKISLEAKVLYGLLLDRNSLSVKNKWVDDKGHVYIYFSREDAMEMLNSSDKPITKAFKDLLSVDLIEEKRQGLGKANIIYVKKFINVGIKESCLNRKNSDSGIVKTPTLESDNLRGSNTDINYTEIKKHTAKILKDLCVEIQNVLGEKIGEPKVKELIKQKGSETVKSYVANWDKYKPHAKASQSAYFVFAVSNELPEPQKNQQQMQSYNNFEQRTYTDEELEGFYTDVSQ